jgi:hypothetical protein
MASVPITPSIRSDIATPESAAIGVAVNGQKLESASRGSSGVLKELALACWRGLPTQVPGRAAQIR